MRHGARLRQCVGNLQPLSRKLTPAARTGEGNAPIRSHRLLSSHPSSGGSPRDHRLVFLYNGPRNSFRPRREMQMTCGRLQTILRTAVPPSRVPRRAKRWPSLLSACSGQRGTCILPAAIYGQAILTESFRQPQKFLSHLHCPLVNPRGPSRCGVPPQAVLGASRSMSSFHLHLPTRKTIRRKEPKVRNLEKPSGLGKVGHSAWNTPLRSALRSQRSFAAKLI